MPAGKEYRCKAKVIILSLINIMIPPYHFDPGRTLITGLFIVQSPERCGGRF